MSNRRIPSLSRLPAACLAGPALGFGLSLALAAPLHAEPLIFAAASMKTALDEIAADWAEGNEPVSISYAGSSALARQIVAGAPADMFISASTQWMDAVEENGTITEGTRRDLLGNTLVLIGPADQVNITTTDVPSQLQGVIDGENLLAMAMVDSVPAGVYGKEALTHLGLWDGVAENVAQADNVRAALALVATGEAPRGIVYASDAIAEPRVKVLGEFPADSHTPITYPVALLEGGPDAETAAAFLEYLSSDSAVEIFRSQGFSVIPSE